MEFKSNFNITNKSKVKIIEQLNEPVSWTSLKERLKILAACAFDN